MLLDLNTHIRKIGVALSARDVRVNLPGLKGSAPAYIISRLLQQQKHLSDYPARYGSGRRVEP
jgi:hypothetical protein